MNGRSTPAERLGALRFLIGAYALVYLLARTPALIGLLRYAPRQFEPVGPVALLDAPLPGWLHLVLVAATVLLAPAFWLGWRFRLCGPAFAVLLVWVLSYRNSWGMIFHTENLLVLHVVVLAGARSADAFALDRSAHAHAEHERYGWPIRLLSAVTVATYLLAGIAKLQHAGFGWIQSDALLHFVAYDNLRKIELGAGYSPLGVWLLEYDALFRPLAAVSLALELAAPLALLHLRVGRAWAAFAWSFHLGVLVVMFIFFPYPLLGFAYLSFFEVERVVRPVWTRLAARLRIGPPN